MEEKDLLEKKELRDQLKDKVQVLTKVKALLLMPNTEVANTKQVSDYYEVDESVIRQLFVRNNDELTEDGARTISGEELRDIKSLSGLKTRAASITIFPQRAILRVGMLLRDSKIAKEIRTQLLNVIENTDDDTKLKELDKEKDLVFKVVTAKDETERLIALSEYHTYMNRYKDYVEKAVKSSTGITTSVIAKELGISSARKLNMMLHDKKVQFRNAQGQWLLYSEYADKDYTAPYTYLDNDGNTHHSTNWTEKGKEFIYKILEKDKISN